MLSKLFAQYLDSRAIGGWYIAESKEAALAMINAALEGIEPAYRHLHKNYGSGMTCTPEQVAFALGGGGQPFGRGSRLFLATEIDIRPTDVSRGTGGWDFTNIQGL